MYKVVVIGDKDSVYGFSRGGLEACFVTEPTDALAQIKRFAGEEYAVIFIVEALYSKIKDQLLEYEETPVPAIIPIPGVTGNTGDGLHEVEKFVERAIGSDIIFGSTANRN